MGWVLLSLVRPARGGTGGICRRGKMLSLVTHATAGQRAGSIPVEIQVALIAAAVSLLTVVLSEAFLRLRARRAAKQTTRETYQKYADPLAMSCTDLFWRLREAFDARGGGFYLKGQVHLTRYEHYKALSTLYRMASLLGWIRALRRELLFLPRTDPEGAERLDAALRRFTSALAEGGHVEARRVESLMHLWGIGEDASPDAIARAGVQVDWRLKGFLHENGALRATDLPDRGKLRLSELVAGVVTGTLGCQPVAAGVLRETRSRSMACLSVREAWIYRDWQSAIGDVMLREAQPGPRLFEVIGYKDFETLCKDGQENDRIWMRRLNTVVDDLDTQGDRSQDARIEQLWTVYIATAEMIRALHLVDPKRSTLTSATFDAANATLTASQN
jgi:hypothetical protein